MEQPFWNVALFEDDSYGSCRGMEMKATGFGVCESLVLDGSALRS